MLATGLILLALPVAVVTFPEDGAPPVEAVGSGPGTARVDVGALDVAPTVAPVTAAPGTAGPTPTVGASPTVSPGVTLSPLTMAAPTATPRQAPTPFAATGSPTPAPSASVLLGPATDGEFTGLVEGYCDRHVSQSSSAEPRGDGWRCRHGGAPRTVDLDALCAETYGVGGYARNPVGGAYGWRCYR